MGSPGSGKGTQAKLLSEKFELEYIETGELLRPLLGSVLSLIRKK
jgi:adenylate kinase family enzyme